MKKNKKKDFWFGIFGKNSNKKIQHQEIKSTLEIDIVREYVPLVSSAVKKRVVNNILWKKNNEYNTVLASSLLFMDYVKDSDFSIDPKVRDFFSNKIDKLKRKHFFIAANQLRIEKKLIQLFLNEHKMELSAEDVKIITEGAGNLDIMHLTWNILSVANFFSLAGYEVFCDREKNPKPMFSAYKKFRSSLSLEEYNLGIKIARNINNSLEIEYGITNEKLLNKTKRKIKKLGAYNIINWLLYDSEK